MKNGFTQSAPGAAQNVQSGPNWNDLAEKEKTWKVLDEVILHELSFFHKTIRFSLQPKTNPRCLVLYFRTELFTNYD